ncbi:hypothetical protein [Micromonospora endolithica]|uniref:Uncharacterized protein n=1 Tax=Micromonospora endolithica TaxID=230091 RepID=A0A3A9ZJ74_9ACTN|nr:hypothetical protein [Micromonospora endolithica]RKN47824.1 hypothetical protein D7223_13865 [Micromonospora endolithica]TWJ21508.1 hypothetical protein JD76_01618 [Micromonospora endolithica]
MVFDWYGAGPRPASGVPTAGWTALEWDLWSAGRHRSAVTRRRGPAASVATAAGDVVGRWLPAIRPGRPEALAALTAVDAGRHTGAGGPVPAARLAYLLGGLSALAGLGSLLDPFVVTMDVSGLPQGLWWCGSDGGPPRTGVRLVPVRAPAQWPLRVARRLTPDGFGQGVAPALVLWRVTWPDVLDPYQAGALLDVYRDLGAAQFSARLLAREAALVGVPTQVLPADADLRDVDWPPQRWGVVGGFAVGLAPAGRASAAGDCDAVPTVERRRRT